uniref:Transmembrane protein n=1 Tax=Cacopsylla melanoneura TaxID=428564 RepID=A0A8D8Y762_9HEMI
MKFPSRKNTKNRRDKNKTKHFCSTHTLMSIIYDRTIGQIYNRTNYCTKTKLPNQYQQVPIPVLPLFFFFFVVLNKIRDSKKNVIGLKGGGNIQIKVNKH